MKYLHLFSNETFANPYIHFINKNFNGNDHLFLLISENDLGKKKMIDLKNVIYIKILNDLIVLLKKMWKSEEIIIHGLFNNKLLFLLCFQPWLLNKCNWVIWGGDLYFYKYRSRKFKTNLKEMMRRFVIRNFGHIVSLVKGDYELAKKWYKVKGEYHHGIYINPINLVFLNDIDIGQKEKNSPINIQIGNSAGPSNNHFEVLDHLSRFKQENICIYVPLSYGDQAYAKKVADYGKGIFGDKFKAMLTFLSPKDYTKYLGSIDIAIFNHDRQQALGNIFALLYLGKKVYIRNNITSWDYIKNQLELDIFDIEDISTKSLTEIKTEINHEKNKENVTKLFSDDYIKTVWEEVFAKE